MQKMPNMQPIGNLLAKRRKELGLSIDKAAEATKLRRHVIEAFEYTDFDAMPPKGYARASMGSYARYLGLNTSEVLRAFDEQLAEYEARQQGYARQDERFQQASSRDASRQDERRRDTRSDQRAGYRQDTRQPQTGRSQGASSPMRTPTRPASSEARAQRGADSRSTYGRPTSSARTSTPAPGRYEAPASRNRQPGRTGFESEPGRYADFRTRQDTARPGSYGASGRRAGSGAAAAGPYQGQRPSSRPRETAQPLDVDSGYEGGSGGRSGGRNQTTHATQQSVSEVLQGILQTIMADRRVMLILVGVIAVVLVVVIAVAATSCTNKASQSQGNSSIPVTSVAGTNQTAQPGTIVDTTKLNPSGIDLTAIPVNSKVSLAFAADAANSVWAEVYVDGNAVYAGNLEAGSTQEWTIGRTLAVTLSDSTGVSIAINGTSVTPTISNGTYVLNATVPEDQWAPDPPADTASQDGSDEYDPSQDEWTDDTDYSDYGSYDDSGYYGEDDSYEG